MNPIIISIDDLKTTFQGYNPSKASVFHRDSAKLADKTFEKELKKYTGKEVILMCGGSASGKTEFLSEYLTDFKGIIFDGTLSTIQGADIKIKKILKAKKKPVICAIFPDDFNRSFIAFLHRDRKFKDDHFYKTHSGSRKTLLWIAKEFPEIEIKIYESTYNKKENMIFKKIIFPYQKQMIEFLENIQYNEQDIITIINKI